MSLFSAIFRGYERPVPTMANARDIRLHPDSMVGVYVSNLNSRPDRRLISFAALDRAIATRIARSVDRGTSNRDRQQTWHELEALRVIRDNVIDYVHETLNLSSDPALATNLAPHLRHIVRSAERDYNLIGASTYEARKIDAFKKIVLRAKPRREQFAYAANNDQLRLTKS